MSLMAIIKQDDSPKFCKKTLILSWRNFPNCFMNLIGTKDFLVWSSYSSAASIFDPELLQKLVFLVLQNDSVPALREV